MPVDRTRDDDLGELFQLFQVLADASDINGATPQTSSPPPATTPPPGNRPTALSLLRPLVQLEPVASAACVQAKFLKQAQADFHLSLRIADDISDDEAIPFLPFVATLRGEVLSQSMLKVFRVSSAQSDDSDSLAANDNANANTGAGGGGGIPMSSLSESLRRRTLAVMNDSTAGIDSVRSSRRSKGTGFPNPTTESVSSKALHLLEKLYSLLSTEIANQSAPIELMSTSWTDKHAADTPEMRQNRRRLNQSIAKKVFPTHFRKQRYTLGEVAALIDAYDGKTEVVWSSPAKSDGHGSTATTTVGSSNPAPGGASPIKKKQHKVRTQPAGDNVKYVALSPLPRLNAGFISKSNDDSAWSGARHRQKSVSVNSNAASASHLPRNGSVVSICSDVDGGGDGGMPAVVSSKTQQRFSLPELRSPAGGRLSTVVGFVEDSPVEMGGGGGALSSPVPMPGSGRGSIFAGSPVPTTAGGGGGGALQLSSPPPRAHSLPSLRSPSLSLPQCASPCYGRASGKLAEVYHQQFPKIPADFKRKFHSDLSDRLYKHIRATKFEHLTVSKAYFMPVQEKLELREQFKYRGAVVVQEEIARVGFYMPSIPTVAAQALEGLQQVFAVRSLAPDLTR